MAILVDKDIALGSPQHVYLRVHPYFTPVNGGVWKIDVFVDFSKRARELKVMRDFVQWRFATVSSEVRFDKTVAQRLSIPDEAWLENTLPGPWTEPDEMEYIIRNFVHTPITTVQSYSLYYYVSEKPVAVPEVAGADAFEQIYNGIKRPDSPLFSVIESPQLEKEATIDTLEDDFESAYDIIERIIKADSVVAKLGPDEKTLPPLPSWKEPLWGPM